MRSAPYRLLAAVSLFLPAISLLADDETKPVFPFTDVPASQVEQGGIVPEGAGTSGAKVLSNEPEGGNGTLIMEFDLESVKFSSTPLARLQFGLEKLPVKRSGQKSGTGKGALHAFVENQAELAGSTAVKPAGIPTPYTIDVTRAVSEALSRPAGQKKIRMEVKMTGKPAYYEVYGLLSGGEQKPPTLDIAPPDQWTMDWEQRLAPITRGATVYREACMPIAESLDQELAAPLLYPAGKIIEVVHGGTAEKLQEGRDWILRDGKLVLPAGSHAPVQLKSEFFTVERKGKDGTVTKGPTTVRLVEGTYYHDRQIEVTYEPASRDWTLSPAVSSLDNLPRLKKRLAEKAPVKVLLFGDSISLGGNATKFQGTWPYQPPFGELVAWKLGQHSGSKITFMNHSRGGAGAGYGAGQAASQAGWFKPDLAIVGYGMNDRRDERRATYVKDIESIIDAIRQESPDTEILLVASMINNPLQPSGTDPIFDLRDRLLSISRPGIAFADVTTTHQDLLKHKNYLDTSGNGANHPNDFLQRIYAQRILEVLIPDETAKLGK